jgi:hypothetical protein
MRPRKETIDMTRDDNTAVDDLWEAARWRLPALSPEEQRAGIVLLRELARGEPVAIADLGRALGTSIDTTEALTKGSSLRVRLEIQG